MSYTQDDLTNIDKAIADMVAGVRVGEFQHNGRRIKYAEVSLPELRALRKTILSAVNPPRRRFSRIVTSKGLD